MVSITLSVSEDVKQKMNEFHEMNWSGFIRSCIEEKTKELSWKEEMLKKLKAEKDLIDWSVSMGKKIKKMSHH